LKLKEVKIIQQLEVNKIMSSRM